MDDSSCCSTGFVGPDQVRLNRDRVAPHSVVVTCRKGHFNLTELKLVAAQTARISNTSQHHSFHMMIERLMVMNIDLILHCVVLLQLDCL